MASSSEEAIVDPRRRKLRGAGRFLLLVGAVLFLFFVFVLSDFNETGMLAVGAFVGLYGSAIYWKTSRKRLRTLAIVVLAVVVVASGILVIRVGRYQREVNRIVAGAVLNSVGGALESYLSSGRSLPDCRWTCMIQEVTDAGFWTELHLRYAETDRTLAVPTIPSKDGWGCRFLYENLGEGRFLLKSSGPDRRFFSEDDLLFLSGAPRIRRNVDVPVWPKSPRT